MNSNSNTVLENFCRTCMNGNGEDKGIQGSPHSSFSIFSEPESKECKNITIMELLMLTTPQLSIDSGDMLPKTVCENCLERLLNAYQFQKMCIRVEQALREMIKEIPIESQMNKDPLKVIPSDSVNLLRHNVLNKFLKIEIDETLIDANVATFGNKSLIDDTEDIKLEMRYDRREDTSDGFGEVDSDIDEWEFSSSNAESKTDNKIVIKNKDALLTLKQQTCEITKNLTTNSMNTSDSKDSEIKNFECDECGNRLSTHKSLKRHKKIHLRTVLVSQQNTLDKIEDEGSNNVECSETKINDVIKEEKQTSEIINDSAKELNVKTGGNKNYECDECGNRLSTRKSLKRHKKIHLRIMEVGQKNTLTKTKYECGFCQKVFQQSSSLKDHIRKHTGEQPYLCSECGKAFKSLSNMKQHFLRHGTERPYVCPDCPKTFPCLSDLASHKAVHNKIKSHVCDICGAAFVKPYLLKKHNMYHTGEKNHKCDYCDMRFVLADHCRRHMRTHTGEKPYKCKYCERAFAQSNDLTKHLRGHLGDNVYKCNLCPQGFRLQGDLRVHFYTHKNDDEETKARNLQALRDEEHRLQMEFGLAKCT